MTLRRFSSTGMISSGALIALALLCCPLASIPVMYVFVVCAGLYFLSLFKAASRLSWLALPPAAALLGLSLFAVAHLAVKGDACLGDAEILIPAFLFTLGLGSMIEAIRASGADALPNAAAQSAPAESSTEVHS